MAIKIALTNQKGRVGKTTTSLNLADQLLLRGYRVLFVDCDPQHNSTDVYGAETDNVPTMYDIFDSGITADKCIQHTKFGDIVPNDSLLMNIDGRMAPSPMMYKYLKKALEPVEDNYDFIIFDTPPVMGVLLGNCLMITDYIIIPIECDAFSVRGLDDIYKTICTYKDDNHGLRILGLLKIKYKGNQLLTKNMEGGTLPVFVEGIGTKIFDTAIRESVKVREANSLHKRLSQYSPKCNSAIDYSNFCDEVLKEVL